MATNTENNVIERVTTGNEASDKKIGEALHVIVQGLTPRKNMLRYEEGCDLGDNELVTVADILGLSLVGGQVGLYNKTGGFYTFGRTSPKCETWDQDRRDTECEIRFHEHRIEENNYEDEKELEEINEDLEFEKNYLADLESVGEELEQAWSKLRDYNRDYYFDKNYRRINTVCEHFDVAYEGCFSFCLGDYTFFGAEHYFYCIKSDLWAYGSEGENSSLTLDEAITIIDEYIELCKP